MPAAEVSIVDHGGGRSAVSVNGVRLYGVRAVRVDKRINDMDVVTVELLARKVTISAAVDVSLADVEALDDEMDARRAKEQANA